MGERDTRNGFRDFWIWDWRLYFKASTLRFRWVKSLWCHSKSSFALLLRIWRIYYHRNRPGIRKFLQSIFDWSGRQKGLLALIPSLITAQARLQRNTRRQLLLKIWTATLHWEDDIEGTAGLDYTNSAEILKIPGDNTCFNPLFTANPLLQEIPEYAE